MRLENKSGNLPEVLTIREVTNLFNVSLMTLRRWTSKGRLKAFWPTIMGKEGIKKPTC